jgi:integrase
METIAFTTREPWNKGKLVGQKTPFKLKEIWAIRVRLQIASRCRDLAMFNLAIDSKLRACDLLQLRVRDVCHGQIMVSRALVLQQKTRRPVQFEITEPTRDAVLAWITEVRRFLAPQSDPRTVMVNVKIFGTLATVQANAGSSTWHTISLRWHSLSASAYQALQVIEEKGQSQLEIIGRASR